MVLCPHVPSIDQSTVLYRSTFGDTSKDSTNSYAGKKLLSRTFSVAVCKQKLKMNARNFLVTGREANKESANEMAQPFSVALKQFNLLASIKLQITQR